MVPPPRSNQRIHFCEDPLGIVRMETAGPELWVFEHFPRGISHDRVHILADERTRVIAKALLVYRTAVLTVIRYCSRSRCVFSSPVRSSTRFSKLSCAFCSASSAACARASLSNARSLLVRVISENGHVPGGTSRNTLEISHFLGMQCHENRRYIHIVREECSRR